VCEGARPVRPSGSHERAKKVHWERQAKFTEEGDRLMPNVGPWEIVLLLFLAVLLFGAKRLPELGRSVGQGMREFKDSISTHTEEVRGYTSDIRAEVADVRQSVTGATADIRDELTVPSFDTVAAKPTAQREHDAA
jgi:sec-independent protein translocase protein TatA